MEMLPTTEYAANEAPKPHESINDLPAHPATMQQIFYPTSESRAFTRVDAGRVFDENLLPADGRIPHPELIELERERAEGIPRPERIARQRARAATEQAEKNERDERRRVWESKNVQTVAPAERGGQGGRWALSREQRAGCRARRSGLDGHWLALRSAA